MKRLEKCYYHKAEINALILQLLDHFILLCYRCSLYDRSFKYGYTLWIAVTCFSSFLPSFLPLTERRIFAKPSVQRSKFTSPDKRREISSQPASNRWLTVFRFLRKQHGGFFSKSLFSSWSFNAFAYLALLFQRCTFSV